MISRGRRSAAGALLAWLVASAPAAQATPSTNFWAPTTPGVQGYGVLHLTYDTYFNSSATYPITTGLEIGVLPGKRVQAELGFDLVYPTVAASGPVSAPLLLNAKIGGPQDGWFHGSPAWSAGIFDVGFEPDVTDYDVLDAVAGWTLPRVGSFAVGGWYGLNERLLRSSTGEVERSGVLAGWFSQAIDVPVIDRLHFTWDVQTGRNVLGATGGGLYVYVTPAIDVLTGPVRFFDPDLQPGGARWMWSMQLDVDMNLLRK